jgi:hypothetical protein
MNDNARTSLGLLALFLLIPAGPLVAGDDEASGPAAAQGKAEAIMADVDARLAVERKKDLALDLDSPRSDSPRPRYTRASHATTLDDQESRSGLSLQFADVYFGALQDPPPDTSLASKGSGTPTGTGHQHESLAEAATNPVAPMIQLQFQNVSNFNTAPGGGYSNVFIVQPVIPFSIGEQAFISRITFPLLATTGDLPSAVGGRDYGTGDLVGLTFATKTFHDKTWGGFGGVGLALTFPTASSDFLGEGKYQAGPGFIYINTATKRVQWGFLAYQQWSYGSSSGNGSRPGVSKLFWSPIVNYHFDHGWYVSFQGDQLWTVDWNDNGQWALPVAFRVGRVFPVFGKQNANVFFQPFYNVTHSDSGGAEWGFKLSFTFLFPE